jgi:nicotinamidase-related amidase
MNKGRMIKLHALRRELRKDANGVLHWAPVPESHSIPADRLALLLCDVWNAHWSRGETERVAELAPRINRVVKAGRDAGMQIIHAPSSCMKFYEGTPARARIQAVPVMELPPLKDHPDPPLPFDMGKHDSDTGEPEKSRLPVEPWSRQHPAIEIDQDRDVVSDEGPAIYSLLRQRGLEEILFMGIHTNMCVMRRSFGIKNLVRWGLKVFLVRDLTFPLSHPSIPPYVNRDEATRLMVEFIEKFWCPTVESRDWAKG